MKFFYFPWERQIFIIILKWTDCKLKEHEVWIIETIIYLRLNINSILEV